MSEKEQTCAACGEATTSGYLQSKLISCPNVLWVEDKRWTFTGPRPKEALIAARACLKCGKVEIKLDLDSLRTQ